MADAKTTLRAQRPVLLIGIGGTGKQVLLNLRRMFYDQYGRATLPHIGHLWIDTDTRNITLDGKQLDFLLKEVDFDATERLGTVLTAADLENYYNKPNEYPHVFSWFDLSLSKHGVITDGARQIRSFGRLAFFHHYEAILERVREKYSAIRAAGDQGLLMSEYGIEVDASSIECWLILSIAGGTGGGMFLDMAFALKEHDPNVLLRSILVLPSVFSNDTRHRIYGNAYAALMELEHYNYAKREAPAAASIDPGRFGTTADPHRFPAAWTRDGYSEGRTLIGPVFQTTYLIGNRARSAGGTLDLSEKGSLCEMLAEALFVEYGGTTEALASTWRSARSNFADSLTGTISYAYRSAGREFQEVFSCRYASLGLAKLYIPVRRIAAIIRHRLAVDIAELWLRRTAVPASLDEQIERRYLPRLKLSPGGEGQDFFRELKGGGQAQPLDDALRQSITAGRGTFLQSAGQPNVGDQVLRWMKDQILVDQLDCTNPARDRWGATSRLIYQQNSEALYGAFIRDLDRILADLLASRDERFDVAREVLRRISTLLERQRLNCVQRAEQFRKSASTTMQEITQRLDWLGDCGGLYTRRALIAVVFELIDERVGHEFRAQTFDAAAKLSERLLDHIGRGTVSKDAQGREIVTETGLLKQLSDLQRTLRDDIRDQLSDRLDALRKLPISAIYQSLYEEQDFDDFYVTETGAKIDEAAIGELDRRFFEEAEGQRLGSLWAMRRELETAGPRRVMTAVLEFTRRATAHLDARTIDVVERLSRRLKPSSDQYAATVRKLLDFGQPWLAKPTHFYDRAGAEKNQREGQWAALHRGDSDAHVQFRGTIERLSPRRIQNIEGDPDRVYLSAEIAGLPLMAVPDLDRYRNQAYFPLLQRGEVLHTDTAFAKFQDLMLKDQPEVDAHVTALEVLGTAILAGVVRGDSVPRPGNRPSVLQFTYLDRSSFFPEEVRLGQFTVGLRRLTGEGGAELRESIRAYTAAIVDNLDELGQARWYLLLRMHAHRNPVGHEGLSMVLASIAARLEADNPMLPQLAQGEQRTLKIWAEQVPPGIGFHSLKLEQDVVA